MHTVILLLAFGCVCGRLLGRRPRWAKTAELLSTASVFGLLFLLGISVGRNPMIRANLGSLGVQAGLIALAASAGSVFLAWGLYRLARRRVRIGAPE